MADIYLVEDNNIQKAIEYKLKAVNVSVEPVFTAQLYLSLLGLYNTMGDYDKHEYYKSKWLKMIGADTGIVSDNYDEEEAE